MFLCVKKRPGRQCIAGHVVAGRSRRRRRWRRRYLVTTMTEADTDEDTDSSAEERPEDGVEDRPTVYIGCQHSSRDNSLTDWLAVYVGCQHSSGLDVPRTELKTMTETSST